MKKMFSLLAIVAVLASCKKDKTIVPASPVEKKLMRMNSVEYPAVSLQYEYDAAGSLVRVEDDYSKTTYTFSGNTVNFSVFSKAQNRITRSAVIALNNKGFIASADVTEYPGPNISKTGHFTYEYNANDNVVKVVKDFGAYKYEVANEIVNGNIVQFTLKTNGVITSVYKYSFSNLPNKQKLGQDYLGIYSTIGGVQNKNLPSKKEEFDAANNKTNEWLYTYETDADGYPAKLTYHEGSINLDYHYIFLYDK